MYSTTMCAQGHNNHREMLTLLLDLSRAMRCCRQGAAFLENVTFSQFYILDLVGERGKLGLAKLHGLLSVDKSTTTRLVGPLVKKGLIRRERSDRDSRAINLRLTKEGQSVRRETWACLSTFVEGIQMRIPEEKRSEVYGAVKLFINAVRNAGTPDLCDLSRSQE